ncbi:MULTISPECIES: hypothetical protein [Nostoc]|uniref:Uncharacterized protein n=2 Tax=Nostoc TaxID=1177 RepID=A0ABR8IFY9_9NOSO|nr:MULTISPECIES: hypothetical protein [Nostoc]MBD2564544.1 hypothetical protein [Nostoc linckia FACHB-391]MBD2650099.1 hypothetical protein [Nostoc foliaceum FACHB-393]
MSRPLEVIALIPDNFLIMEGEMSVTVNYASLTWLSDRLSPEILRG